MEIKRLLKKSWLNKSIKLSGFIFGLILTLFLAINTQAQNIGQFDYSNTSIYRINYGNNLSDGLQKEQNSYAAYKSYLLDYDRKSKLEINEEYRECYRQARNISESKQCAEEKKKKEVALANKIDRLTTQSFNDYIYRKDIIGRYWDQRDPSKNKKDGRNGKTYIQETINERKPNKIGPKQGTYRNGKIVNK